MVDGEELGCSAFDFELCLLLLLFVFEEGSRVGFAGFAALSQQGSVCWYIPSI